MELHNDAAPENIEWSCSEPDKSRRDAAVRLGGKKVIFVGNDVQSVADIFRDAGTALGIVRGGEVQLTFEYCDVWRVKENESVTPIIPNRFTQKQVEKMSDEKRFKTAKELAMEIFNRHTLVEDLTTNGGFGYIKLDTKPLANFDPEETKIVGGLFALARSVSIAPHRETTLFTFNYYELKDDIEEPPDDFDLEDF